MLEKMKQYRRELGEDTAVTAREVVTTPGLYFVGPPLSHTTGSQSRRRKGKHVLLQVCAKPRTEETESEFTYSLYQAGSLQDGSGLS